MFSVKNYFSHLKIYFWVLTGYKFTDYYHPEDQGCLLWNDPEVGIDWPIKNPILSERDKEGLLLNDL